MSPLLKSTLVQGHLFAPRSCPERILVDETTGLVTREVERSDPEKEPVTSEIGHWDRSVPLHDLRAMADSIYLRRALAPTVSQTASEVRVVDLFSGCGAMSLGVAEACRALGMRFVPVAAFDNSERALGVYTHNLGHTKYEPRDLSELLQHDLTAELSLAERELRDQLEHVDLVLAGPPCQGHSNLNNRTRRRDPKNRLYFLVARFAHIVRPRFIMIENVMAVLNDQDDVVHHTQTALESLGYETADGVVDLWSIGVPQTRRRHMLVARTRDSQWACPLHVSDIVLPYRTRARSVKWAIEDLLNTRADGFMDRASTPDQVTQGRIEYLFDHDLYDLPNSQRPECHRSGEHSYGAVYGRMRWDDPAPTITTGFKAMGQGRFVHPKRRRTITPHEAARLQSIPDFFDFSPVGSYRNTLTELIGNAAPPKLSYTFALELLR